MSKRQETAMTWKIYLKKLELINLLYIDQNNVNDVLDDINVRMQAKFPGPYTVIRYLNQEGKFIDYKLQFDDPAQETLWLLKNS